MFIDCILVCRGLERHVLGKKMLLQVMKYVDLLNWKNKCFGKYCPTKLNRRASETIIIYRGDKLGKMTWLMPFSIFHATRYHSVAKLFPHKRLGWEKSACGNMRKKAGSITNLRSREGQVEHGEVTIYCTSIHTMESSSACVRHF